MARRDESCFIALGRGREILGVHSLTSRGRRVYLTAGGQFTTKPVPDGLATMAWNRRLQAAVIVRGRSERCGDGIVFCGADGLQLYVHREVGPQRALVRGAPRSVGRPRPVPLAPLAPRTAGWRSQWPGGPPARSAAPPAAALARYPGEGSKPSGDFARTRAPTAGISLALRLESDIIRVLRAVYRIGQGISHA
jgi:hypothetical protein